MFRMAPEKIFICGAINFFLGLNKKEACWWVSIKEKKSIYEYIGNLMFG